jgi:hypothetical protein
MVASIFFTAAIIRAFRSFGFLVIIVCNHGEYYEMPRMTKARPAAMSSVKSVLDVPLLY